MIVLTPEIKTMLLENSAHREVIIEFPEAAQGEISKIESENIIADSLELTQSICDESEFVFGGCIAGQLVIQVIGIEESLNNKRINVFLRQTYSTESLSPTDELYPSDGLFPGLQYENTEIQIFSGTINSSMRQKNRNIKEIVAYDDLYGAANIICYEYFRSLAIYSPNIALGVLRETLVDNFLYNGYEYSDGLFNDDKCLSLSVDLVKSVCTEKLTVFDLLRAYCELNACFAYINGEGQIKFIQLLGFNKNSPNDDKTVEVIEYYSDLSFEEYTTAGINMIKFPYNKDNMFAFGNTAARKQSWYIADNIISKCCTDISEIVNSFYSKDSGANYFYMLYSYRPFTADIFARWWIEPGDKVKIKTGYNDTEYVESFVFSRTVKGINGMKITLKSQGTEYLGKDEIKANEL